MTYSVKFTYWLHNIPWWHVERYVPTAIPPYGPCTLYPKGWE